MGKQLSETDPQRRSEHVQLDPPGVFLNHSCVPNTGVTDDRWLVALHEIAPGEELRYDYSTTMHENRWTMACRCGATDCRGLVTDFRLLSPVRQQHYLRLGVVQPFIVRALATAQG